MRIFPEFDDLDNPDAGNSSLTTVIFACFLAFMVGIVSYGMNQ